MPDSIQSSSGRLRKIVDEKLAGFGTKLASPQSRPELLKGCVRGARLLLRLSMGMYLLGLLLLCLLMRHVGEQNIFFAFCLYLPPMLWLLPLIMLVPLCLFLLEWRGLVAGIVGVSVAAIGFFDFKPSLNAPVISAPENRGKDCLVVLTNNRGQHGNHSMKPFKNLVRPDVMVFQEDSGVSTRYLADPGYAEFKYGRDVGEFSLVSRYPIQTAESVLVEVRSPVRVGVKEAPIMERLAIAARFLIDFEGRPVVIYNVHLPTPRDTLRYYYRGAFIYGLIGIPGTPLGEKRALNQQGWDMRTEMIRKLVERAVGEKVPVILAGDFNMPSQGWNHSIMSHLFQDAHEKAGSGFGFTFPGITKNPLSLGGPWMRIDYIFGAPDNWSFIASAAEEQRASQHRATAAQVVLRMMGSTSS